MQNILVRWTCQGCLKVVRVSKRRRLLTNEQHEFLLEHQADVTRKEMAELLNETFGTSLTTEQIKTYCGNHKIRSNSNGQFKKGQRSFNKGLKQTDYMSEEAIERTKATRFKKGQKPNNWKPIGSERITKDGYIEIKVRDGEDVSTNNYKLKHRVVWEEEHGEVPEGHAILFLDQSRTNCSLDNLMLVKRTELVRINKSNNLVDVPEINESIVLTERIRQKIREVSK